MNLLFYLIKKYLASGWCTIIAFVVCSGTICHSSVKVTPILSGFNNSNMYLLSSRFGHAG